MCAKPTGFSSRPATSMSETIVFPFGQGNANAPIGWTCGRTDKSSELPRDPP